VIEKRMDERRATANLEIHRQESYFSRQIAAAQLGVEVDAIENLHSFRSEANMLAVEIAMDVALSSVKHNARVVAAVRFKVVLITQSY
jgi:hypothetical protein